MKWFKHDACAGMDAKLKKLRLRYGLEGYGLYWYLLECIARTVEPHNLTYELEEDSELLAAELNMNRDQVEEMMLFMVDLSLFEQTDGIVSCLKLRDRSDEYTQKLLRKVGSVRTISRPAPEKVPPIRTEKNRREEKKISKKTLLPEDFSISDGVRAWAEKNGHRRLNAHLEHFVDKAKAKNYRYADWDAAFKGAIRENWAGVQ
jgi:hypothetical protein